MIVHTEREVTLTPFEQVISDRFNELLSDGQSIARTSLTVMREARSQGLRPSAQFVAWLSEDTVRLTRHGVAILTEKGRRFQ